MSLRPLDAIAVSLAALVVIGMAGGELFQH